MPELTPSLLGLATFLASLLALAWLSRQIGIFIQIPIYYLTRSNDASTVALFLAFLPGIIVHESAHWGVARLLGLRTGKFRVWPRRQGKHIGLGSVSVQSGGTIVDSIVGVAPLVIGSLFVGWISHRIFGAYDLARLLYEGNLLAGVAALRAAFYKPDAILWAYLLFAIANAMMPSASDREPVKPILLYALIAVCGYFVLGMPAAPIQSVINWMMPALNDLTSAFLFTILLDLAALTVLYVVRVFVAQ